MLRVARGYVRSHETAEEVVQEAWLALLKGIGKFEGRSSLRTWLFTVLINIAKTRGRATAAIRTSKSWRSPAAPSTPPVRRNDRYPGHWRQDEVPAPFPDTPEGSVLGDELVGPSHSANSRNFPRISDWS